MGNWRFRSRKGEKVPSTEEVREKAKESMGKRQQTLREQEDFAIQQLHANVVQQGRILTEMLQTTGVALTLKDLNLCSSEFWELNNFIEKRRREPLITNIMWRNVMTQAFYQVTVLLLLTFKGNDILNLNHDNTARANKVRNTVIFNAFVLCQIFNEFNSRKPDQINIFQGLRSSHLFVGIMSFTLVIQVLIVEFAGKIASTTPLNWEKWMYCIVIGFISWPLAAIVKFIPVPATPFLDYFSLNRGENSSEHRLTSDGEAEVNEGQNHHMQMT